MLKIHSLNYWSEAVCADTFYELLYILKCAARMKTKYAIVQLFSSQPMPFG